MPFSKSVQIPISHGKKKERKKGSDFIPFQLGKSNRQVSYLSFRVASSSLPPSCDLSENSAFFNCLSVLIFFLQMSGTFRSLCGRGKVLWFTHKGRHDFHNCCHLLQFLFSQFPQTVGATLGGVEGGYRNEEGEHLLHKESSIHMDHTH